jgi:hypothetical protein
MSYQDSQPGDLPRIHRVIDLKLPLNWLLTVAFSLALLIGGMYFQLRQLSEDMTDLKMAVKTGNGQSATIQGELAILRFRVENLESEKRASK